MSELHGALCLLLAGLFASSSGWWLRRVVAEGEAETLEAVRAKLREAVGVIEAQRARVATESKRADALADALAVEVKRAEALTESADAARRAAEGREREVERHERHIVELADEIATRDLELAGLRRRVEALEANVRSESERVRKVQSP